MLLVLDIGNTNIAMGTYEGKELCKHWRISTDRQKTGDEYGMLINSLFHYQGIEMADIHAIIISSVVPPLVVPFIKMCELRRESLLFLCPATVYNGMVLQ